MPWHGLAVAANGNIKPCCQWSGSLGKVGQDSIIEVFKSGQQIVDLRNSFLKGEKPSSCKSCWQRENQIGESRRLWFREKFTKTIPNDYNYSTSVEEKDLLWTQMDINLTNVCNLKCRMCGSWASNQWFEEDVILANINPAFEKESNPKNQVIRQHELEDLRQLVPHLSSLNRIDFKGGEPMLAKNHVEFLEMLIENGLHDQIDLQYTTNGTVVNPKILNTLSKFNKVRLIFSIEGTGDLYSYIRGGKYTIQQLEDTMKLYNSLPNVFIGFNVTVQAYNLLNLAQLYQLLHQWADKYQNVHAGNSFTTICNNPAYLGPFVLPKSLRLRAISNLQDIKDFSVLVKNLNDDSFYQKYWKTFKQFTTEVDKLRNEDVFSVIPELKEFWHD